MENNSEDVKAFFENAQEHFNEGRHKVAEPMLNQLILKNHKSPMIFHMLGTIYYEQGKFSKAIRTFRRALEIDPAFTDASVGLSIILNDLGRYEEGRKVFEEAQLMLARKSAKGDPYINEKISIKHDELGELYYQHKRYQEALDQYTLALKLSTRTAELSSKIADCLIGLKEYPKAVAALSELINEFPKFSPARLKIGKLYYDSNQMLNAIGQWEAVLSYDPNNRQAKDYLRLAQSVETAPLTEPNL